MMKMVNSNSILVPLLFLLISISPSFAHFKPQPCPPPPTPSSSHNENTPPPTPSSSHNENTPPTTPPSSHNENITPLTPSPSNNENTPPTTPSVGNDGNISFKFSFTKIFAFGESFTDTGNALSLGGLVSFDGALTSNDSPYGSTFFKQLVNRFSDGRLVVDFLAEKLGKQYLQPYKNTSADFSSGVNFAVAGSTAIPSDYYKKFNVGRTVTWKSIPECVQTQMDWFNEYVKNVECKGKDDSACKADMENVLFWIGEMGAADYSRTFGGSFTTHALTKISVNQAVKLVETIIANGGKYVVVAGLPPIGCFPLDLSICPLKDVDNKGCSRTVNAIIKAHNYRLQAKLKELQRLHSSCVIIYADYWSAYFTILANPQKYGFQETHKACCGTGDKRLNFDLHSLCGTSGTSSCADPSKYMSWDGMHLTEAMHSKMADLFFNHGFCQPSFDLLFKIKKSISINKNISINKDITIST